MVLRPAFGWHTTLDGGMSPYKESEDLERLGFARNSHRLLLVLSGTTDLAGRGLELAIILLTSGLGDSLGILLVLVDSPIKNIVVLKALTDEQIAEDLAEIAVVWLIVEAERTSIVKVDGKLVGEATAQNVGRCCHLLLHNSIVLLLLGGSLETLPREGSTTEIQHDVSERFHVITARLF